MTADFGDAVLRRGTAPEAWPFHMPGHRGGAGASAAARALLGPVAFAADVTELQGLDYLHDARHELAAAQARAARVFGADRTWFLVNGATVGNLAAVLAVASAGEDLIVMRASHRSTYGGITLAGARPRYLVSGYDDDLAMALAPTVDEARSLLAADPATRAIHITSPSYYGVCADVAAFAELAHRHRVPLVVDEAHGAHFASGARGLPPSALTLGADLVVQSPHKTLSSLTQSSLLHVRGDLVEHDVVDRWLGILQSTSPSSLLLASLDLAIDAFEIGGAAPWERAVATADEARASLCALGGVAVLGDELVGRGGVGALDPTKVVIDVSGAGRTGYDVARSMTATHGCYPEFADPRRIVVSIGPADDATTVGLLVAAITAALDAPSGHAPRRPRAGRLALPPAPLTPREASVRGSQPVTVAAAAGRVVAEYVIPYPPGVPLAVPGERLDAELLATLAGLHTAGARIVGPVDRSGATLRCLREEPAP